MSTALSALRREAYTGDDRCWPCTAVNVVLLVLACAVLTAMRRGAVAAVLFVVGVAAIALRGYLVPYTPAFAPRLVAALPWDPFHGDAPDASDSLTGDGLPDGESILDALVAAGVVVPDGEDLALHERFRTDWEDEIERLRAATDDDLAAAAASASPTAERAEVVTEDGERYVVLVDDEERSLAAGTWLTMPVALAEIAAVRVLRDAGLEERVAVAAAEPLRMFLERCPACGGPVVETTEASCCGGPSHPRRGPADVLACEDCDRRLYTFPPEEPDV